MNKIDTPSLGRALKQYKDLRELYADIKGDLEKVEDTLRQFAESPNKIISEISEYLFRRSGKRLRPALLTLSSRIFDYDGSEHILLSALVETIHTASLIHDDIIDNSDVRRGQDTVHMRWGPNITVLLGDYLYIQAIARSLGTSSPEFIRILTDVSSEMIEGELHEYDMSGNLRLTEEDYLGIITKKTASLFAASCRIGALLGGAEPDEEQAMADYGMALGMSFQIIDDLLDYTGDIKKMGKPVLSDLSEGRITLPLINTLNQSSDGVRMQLAELFQNKEQDPQAKSQILEIVRSNGALDYTYQQAFGYTQKAQSLVECLPPSKYRDSLERIPEYVLYRNR